MIANYLLDCGSPFITLDVQGWNTLHDAAQFYRLAFYQRLLDLGVESNIRNSDGDTAIDIMLTHGKKWDAEDKVLKAASDGVIQYFKAMNPVTRLLNERRIIQTLLSIEEMRTL